MNDTFNPHDAANFKPEEYTVLDYLDNQRPRYCGGDPRGWAEEIKQWEANISHYFPTWRNGENRNPNHDIHHCRHCGNGMVRYIVAVEHVPTKEVLVFGSECVTKLNFANRDELRLAQIRARAEQGNARMKVYQDRLRFLEAYPDLKAIVESKQIENPVHANNAFAKDVLFKFNHYGSLSDAQVNALVASLQRDIDRIAVQAQREADKAKALAAGVKAPIGRKTVRGEVVAVKQRESQFGIQMKWVVRLDDGSAVYSSVPSSVNLDGLKGKRVEFTATFEAARDNADPLFSFGKRPTKATVLATV